MIIFFLQRKNQPEPPENSANIQKILKTAKNFKLQIYITDQKKQEKDHTKISQKKLNNTA